MKYRPPSALHSHRIGHLRPRSPRVTTRGGPSLLPRALASRPDQSLSPTTIPVAPARQPGKTPAELRPRPRMSSSAAPGFVLAGEWRIEHLRVPLPQTGGVGSARSSLSTWFMSPMAGGALVSIVQDSSVRWCWCREFKGLAPVPLQSVTLIPSCAGQGKGERCEIGSGSMMTI